MRREIAMVRIERVTRINSLKVRFLGDKVLHRQAWKVADQLGWEIAPMRMGVECGPGRVQGGTPSRGEEPSRPAHSILAPLGSIRSRRRSPRRAGVRARAG